MADTTFTPNTGHLSLSRLTVAVLTLSASLLSATGASPSVQQGSVAPGTGSLTLTGSNPQLSAIVTVSAGSLSLTSIAPRPVQSAVCPTAQGTLSLSLGPLNSPLQPLAGTVSLTGTLVTGLQNNLIATGKGTLLIVGSNPLVVVTTPVTGTLSLTGAAPILAVSAIPTVPATALQLLGTVPVIQLGVPSSTVTPVGQSLVLTMTVSSVLQNNAVSPGSGSLFFGDSIMLSLTPVAGTCTLSAQRPTAPQGTVRTMGLGTLTLASPAPAVMASTVVQPSTGALVVTATTSPVIQNDLHTPLVGSLLLSGSPPTFPGETICTPSQGSLLAVSYILNRGFGIQPAVGGGLLSTNPPDLLSTGGSPLVGTMAFAGSAPTVIAVGVQQTVKMRKTLAAMDTRVMDRQKVKGS